MSQLNNCPVPNVLAASVKGKPRAQDETKKNAFAFLTLKNGTLLAAIADRSHATSALLSTTGSKLAVDTALKVLLQYKLQWAPLREIWASENWRSIFEQVINSVQSAITEKADWYQIHPHAFAIKLTVAVATHKWIAYGQVGDGEIVAQRTDGTTLNLITHSKLDRLLSQNYEINNKPTFVTSEDALKKTPVGFEYGFFKAVALVTNGVLDVAFAKEERRPLLSLLTPLFDITSRSHGYMEDYCALRRYFKWIDIPDLINADRTLLLATFKSEEKYWHGDPNKHCNGALHVLWNRFLKRRPIIHNN